MHATLDRVVPPLAHPESVAAALEGIRCAVADATPTYLSVPVTSGPRFVDWLRRPDRPTRGTPDYSMRHEIEVVRPNIAAARDHARAARRRWGDSPLVNPAALNVPGWTQGDYLRLWLAFVETDAARIVAAPGWALSSGCVLEVAAALERRRQVHLLDGSALNAGPALDEIKSSIGILSGLSLDTRTFEVSALLLDNVFRTASA